MAEVGQALEHLVVERGLLSAAELSRLGGGARLDPVVLAGHLVAMGRVRPEQLGPLMAEAEGLAAVRAAPAPHERMTVIDEGPPLPLPGASPGFVPHAAHDEPTRAAPLLRGRETMVLGDFAPPGAASTVAEEAAQAGEPAPLVEAPPPEPAPDDGRRRVGRYALLDELGRGAMGVVFRVSDGQQEYALKLLHTTSPGRLQRFQEELRLLLRLNHPGLVRIRDGGTDRGRPWFVMDLVRGRDLRDVLKERVRLAAPDAARVVIRCARALHHAHEHGVLHRDIKPENIRVDAQLAPTIVDFGLAKDLELSSGLTHTGASIGTPYYMAPEQAAGRTHDVDVRTDVWGLGVLLYELLSGDVPFHAQSNDGLARQIIGAEPRRLLEVAGEVPPALEAVCLRALAKARDARWPDAGALADALEAALADPRDRPSSQPRRNLLVGLATVLCAGAALSFVLPGRPRVEAVAEPAPVASAAPAAGDPLGEARAQARAGRIEEALRLVGSDLEREVSFLRAERRALLSGPERPGVAGLRLVLAAEAGATPRAVGRALTLLAGAPEDSPALQEARARAALLAHDPETARFAAEAALAASPGDPQALQLLARAEAAGLTAEGGRLLDAHAAAAAGAEPPGSDPAALDLAVRWEGVAGRLAQARALERSVEALDQARLWTAHAWSQALTWRRLGGEPPAGPACQAARGAALAELEPLLSLLPGERLRAARRALARATPAQLEQAEDQLANAAGGLGARGGAMLAAALLSTRLEDPGARERAEAWLALGGDLPARALLALEAAARAAEPGERERQLRRAARLAPDLPQVQAAALTIGRRSGAGPDAAGLRALARALVAAPGLALALRAPLVAAPLSPRELGQALHGLVGEDRDTQLARALARLHALGGTPETAALAAEEASAAAASDPGCMLAHLLRAEALLAANALSRALEALDCARAAAPGAAAPILVSLRAQPEPPTSEALQPLLLQGWVARLPRLFLDVPLPDRLLATLQQPELDLRQARARVALLLALEKEELSPLLAFDLRLSRLLDLPRSALAPRQPLPMVPGARPTQLDEWLGRGLLHMDELGPERWAAEAEACLREAEWRPAGRREDLRRRAIVPSLRALGRATPAGGDPRLHPEQLRAAGVELAGAGEGGPLPDAPQLAWTWFQRLRRPDLQLARAAELLDPQPPRLTPAALAAPLGMSQALLAAVQAQEVQADGAIGLLLAGEPDEAHLALARAAAFSRAGDPARDWWELTRSLAQRVLYGADEPPPGGVELLDLCLREGLQRFGDRARDRSSLQAQRADLLLWQAGRAGAGEARRRYLELAAGAAGEVDPQQVEELAFWGPWREARLRAAEGDREGAAAALQRARRVLNPLEARLLGDPPRRAVLRDPLRSLLEPVPGFSELVETLTPRE